MKPTPVFRFRFLLFVAALSYPLAGCETIEMDTDLPYTPSTYVPASSYSSKFQQVYDDGYRLGRKDAQNDLSYKLKRHASHYDWSTQAAFEDGYGKAYRNYSPHHGSTEKKKSSKQSSRSNSRPKEAHHYHVVVGQGVVSIMDGTKTLSKVRTARQNIERNHFTNNHTQLVVKSRGNHGPATVELFDVKTGALRDKVLAFAIKNGEPSWARGMQD